ncbi:Tim44-like domain-containing protein [Paraburkholderia sp. CNPSo 3274]|uniref:Tim44 domain-containing protein n=1 Tax=Paraburkholderia sp. CNPSo 3274 TaxID=2940932 RepID=UPI0020B7AAB6|nr:TIM44-like domain-containing protein [Paraburkholderia sp. CNPSo 3274]MCP3713360.1 Tim44-like domain-containing protein [Paraburkholderia sp. CNPSo 3274]
MPSFFAPHTLQHVTALFARRLAVLSLIIVLALGTLTSFDAQAKRVGGGQSVGRQSQMAPSQPATPAGPAQRTQQAQPAQQTAAAPAAAPGNRWMGPLAGLAAGLGIAALLSHFGLGEGFAQLLSNALLIGLVVFAGVALFRFIARKRRPELAYPQSAQSQPSSDFSHPSQYTAQSAQPYAALPVAMSDSPAANIPADFDHENFLRMAKVSFVRLQAAWDKGDQGDLFEFTTPGMFAELKMDLETRGDQPNRTDVVELHAELLGVDARSTEQVSSVRFYGLIRETENVPAAQFQEIWNFVRATPGEQTWRLAGIQQLAMAHGD